MGKDVSSFRHPERSRGIFLAGRKTVHKRKSVIPSRMKYGVYRSPHIFYLTGVQGRFLASLEMTIPGKAVLSFSALETLFPPLFHTASTLSGSLRSPPSPRGEGFVRRHWFSPRILYSLWLYRIMACRACILRKQKPLCEDGLCRAVSGSIILRSRILQDFSAYPHHFLS